MPRFQQRARNHLYQFQRTYPTVSPHFENTIFELFDSTHSPVIFSECNQYDSIVTALPAQILTCSTELRSIHWSLLIAHCWPQSR